MGRLAARRIEWRLSVGHDGSCGLIWEELFIRSARSLSEPTAKIHGYLDWLLYFRRLRLAVCDASRNARNALNLRVPAVSRLSALSGITVPSSQCLHHLQGALWLLESARSQP